MYYAYYSDGYYKSMHDVVDEAVTGLPEVVQDQDGTWFRGTLLEKK